MFALSIPLNILHCCAIKQWPNMQFYWLMIDMCNSFEHTSNSFSSLLHSDPSQIRRRRFASAALLYEDDRYRGKEGETLIKRAQIGGNREWIGEIAEGRGENTEYFTFRRILRLSLLSLFLSNCSSRCTTRPMSVEISVFCSQCLFPRIRWFYDDSLQTKLMEIYENHVCVCVCEDTKTQQTTIIG